MRQVVDFRIDTASGYLRLSPLADSLDDSLAESFLLDVSVVVSRVAGVDTE